MIFYFLYYFSFQSFHYSHTFLFLFFFFSNAISSTTHVISIPTLFFSFSPHSSSTLILPSSSPAHSLWFFFFFFLHTRFFLSLYLPLLFFLFLPHSRSAFSLLFSPALGLWFFFFFLLNSNTAVVFVRRVGGRGHLCNFTLSTAFSPQFSSRFGRKKIGGSGRKIFF